MKARQDIALFMCIQLWIMKESDCQEGYCRLDKPDAVVNICTTSVLTMTATAYIDTVNVPKFQQTLCECSVAPSFQEHLETRFSFILSGRFSKTMKFKFKDVVLNSIDRRGLTYTRDATRLYFSSDENNTQEEACLQNRTNSMTKFNIFCSRPKTIITTPLFTDTTTLVTSEDRATEASKHNITVTVATADPTTDASKGNITTRAQNSSRSGMDSSGNLTAIVVPAVVGAMLILTVSVILFVYIKRRRFVKETNHQEQELHATPALSEPVMEQGQCHQNNASGKECGLNISVNQYERLNMYVNDKLASEMYQQLRADQNEDYQEMNDVKKDSGNQHMHCTTGTSFEDGKGQDNNSNETSTNAYEGLNMYVNDTLPGEMYQQLQADGTGNDLGKSVSVSEHRTIANSDHTGDTNEKSSAEYTNAISQDDEYDDIA